MRISGRFFSTGRKAAERAKFIHYGAEPPSRDEEVRVYTEAANQEVMNAAAIGQIAAWESKQSLLTGANDVPDGDGGKVSMPTR